MNDKTLTKEFVSGAVLITREDYESMPSPMYALEFNDKKMQALANNIADTLKTQYGFGETEIEDVTENGTDKDIEEFDNIFWSVMESCAVEMGMRYYEDMDSDEYRNIIGK